MELQEAIAARRSVRKFTADAVPVDDVLAVIGSAVQAANAGNEQLWHFHVITDAGLKDELAAIVRRKLESIGTRTRTSAEELRPLVAAATLFAGAPVLVVVTTARYRSRVDRLLQKAGWSEADIDVLRCRPDLQSVGAAVQMLLLAAWERGYGTCYMTGPMVARPELEARLGVEAPQSLAAFVALGKAAIVPVSRGRKPTGDVVTVHGA